MEVGADEYIEKSSFLKDISEALDRIILKRKKS